MIRPDKREKHEIENRKKNMVKLRVTFLKTSPNYKALVRLTKQK